MFTRSTLRGAALAGVAVVLIQQAATSVSARQPRQEWGIVVLMLAVAAVIGAVIFLMPDAGRQLLRHPDLMVPLGLLVFAEALVGWLALVPVAGPLVAAKPVSIVGIGLSLSAVFVIVILLRVAYAAWQTSLILHVVGADRSDPIECLANARRWFLRILAMELFGWFFLFVGVAAALLLAPVAMVLALLTIGVWTIVWNLATAALLPAAVLEPGSFLKAICRALAIGRQGLGRWGHVVVAQLLLLGAATFYSVSFTEKQGASTTHNSTSSWSVNGFWTGGFENECRWYEKLAEITKAPRVPLLSMLFGLLFGVLAILVKLHVAARLPEGLIRTISFQEETVG